MLTVKTYILFGADGLPVGKTIQDGSDRAPADLLDPLAPVVFYGVDSPVSAAFWRCELEQTDRVPLECLELKETDRPRSGQTATGYGAKLPSAMMVRVEGRWRRVYHICFGNAASSYFNMAGRRVFIY